MSYFNEISNNTFNGNNVDIEEYSEPRSGFRGNIIFFIMIGVLYGFDVLFWYKCLDQIEMSKASVIVSPMPILVAFFAFIILGESFTIFHLIGTVIIIFSIKMIVRKGNNN